MIKVDNSFNVRMYYGETFHLPIFINAGCKLLPKRYIISSTSRLVFILTSDNFGFGDIVFQKVFGKEDCNECGDVVIHINGHELQNIEPGRYFYSVRLINDDDDCDTIIDHREFMIMR